MAVKMIIRLHVLPIRQLLIFKISPAWPDVSGPCSVIGTDNTESSAWEKCCLMPCSFKPLSRSNTLSSICFKRQQSGRELCLQKGSGTTLPLLLLFFSPRFFCMGRITSTTSVRHHLRFMPLWAFSWMRWRASETRGCTCFFPLISSLLPFNTLLWLTPADWTEKKLLSPVTLDGLRRAMPLNVVAECQRIHKPNLFSASSTFVINL